MDKELNEVYFNEKVVVDATKQYFHNISRYPLLTAEEEKTLFLKMGKGNDDARTTLINSNLRLVASIARKYNNISLTFLDLIQEGNIGLLKAIEKFDVEKGFRFSTYATYWIKQSINNAIIEQNNTIRLPAHIARLNHQIKKAEQKYFQEHNKTPTAAEIAVIVDAPIHTVSNLMNNAWAAVSFETPVGDEDDSQLGDFIEDDESLVEETNKSILSESILKILNEKLNDKEQKIIIERFGLKNGKEKTLEEIGEELGLTKQRILQIQNSAIRKLRTTPEIINLKNFI